MITPKPLTQHLPGAHFLAPKVEKVGKVHFFRKSALFSPQIIDLTWENIRAGALGPLGGGKVHFSGKVQKVCFYRKSRSNTSVISLRGTICQKVKFFLKFPKNEKVTKSHFRVFAYVYEEIGGPGRSKSQKCVLSNFLHFCAPESPSRAF